MRVLTPGELLVRGRKREDDEDDEDEEEDEEEEEEEEEKQEHQMVKENLSLSK